MLHLRSEDALHQCDSIMTEQTTDVGFVPTLSELSGELCVVPITLTGHDVEEGLELKPL